MAGRGRGRLLVGWLSVMGGLHAAWKAAWWLLDWQSRLQQAQETVNAAAGISHYFWLWLATALALGAVAILALWESMEATGRRLTAWWRTKKRAPAGEAREPPRSPSALHDPAARRLEFQAAMDSLTARAERTPQWPASEVEVTELIADTEKVVRRYCTSSTAALILKSFKSEVSTPFLQGAEQRQSWESVLMRYPDWASKVRDGILERHVRLDDPEAVHVPLVAPSISAQRESWKHAFRVALQGHVDSGNALGEEASVDAFLEWLKGPQATMDDYLTNASAKRERMHFANVFNSHAILREGKRRANVPRRACISWIDRLRGFVTDDDLRPDFKKRPLIGRDPWPGVRYEAIPDIIPGVPDDCIRWVTFREAGLQAVDIRKWPSIREWEASNGTRFGPPARPAPPETTPEPPPA